VKTNLTKFVVLFCLFSLLAFGCAEAPTGFSGITRGDGILYVGSMDGKIIAVNASARSQQLHFPADGEWVYAITTTSQGGLSCGPVSTPVAIYGIPAVDEDLVFIGTYNGKVYALSTLARSQNLNFPQTRDKEWFYPKTDEVIGSVVGSPVVSDDAIYVTSSNGKVYSLHKDFGDQKWESDILANKLWSTPYIEGDKVYISTFDGHLYALSADDGSITWSFATESKIGFVSSPVVSNGVIFVGSFDRNLHAVKVESNETLWKFAGGNCFWATPLVSNNVVYAGCLDGEIYAIDAGNGTQLWSFDAGSPIVASPLLVDDLLIIACDSGEVYVLKTEATGDDRIVNQLSIGTSIRASLCASGDVVYMRGQDNCLYALDVKQGKETWNFTLTTE